MHAASHLLICAMLSCMLALTLTACGKRGDPYRPSEIRAEIRAAIPQDGGAR